MVGRTRRFSWPARSTERRRGGDGPGRGRRPGCRRPRRRPLRGGRPDRPRTPGGVCAGGEVAAAWAPPGRVGAFTGERAGVLLAPAPRGWARRGGAPRRAGPALRSLDRAASGGPHPGAVHEAAPSAIARGPGPRRAGGPVPCCWWVSGDPAACHERQLDRRGGRRASGGLAAVLLLRCLAPASSRQVRREPWCRECGATTDLTADHLATSLADGGRPVRSTGDALPLAQLSQGARMSASSTGGGGAREDARPAHHERPYRRDFCDCGV